MTLDTIKSIIENNISSSNYIGFSISGNAYCDINDYVSIKMYLPNKHITAYHSDNMKEILYNSATTKLIVTDIINQLSKFYEVSLCATHSDMRTTVYHIRKKAK